jgi:hypothetical protein
MNAYQLVPFSLGLMTRILYVFLVYLMQDLRLSTPPPSLYTLASFFNANVLKITPSFKISLKLKLNCYMFRPYLAILRQLFTCWNCYTALDLKVKYFNVIPQCICLRASLLKIIILYTLKIIRFYRQRLENRFGNEWQQKFSEINYGKYSGKYICNLL